MGISGKNSEGMPGSISDKISKGISVRNPEKSLNAGDFLIFKQWRNLKK